MRRCFLRRSSVQMAYVPATQREAHHGTTLYRHPGSNAELVQYDFRNIKETIEKASRACRPLLESRPALPDIYGKQRRMNRNVGFFANPSDSYGYFYSGQLSASQSIPAPLQELLEHINARLSSSFNGVLLNEYESGENYISPHRDDERNLDKLGVLAVSFGTPRTFRLREYVKGRAGPIVANVKTLSCHALLMRGSDFQTLLTHEIPVEKKVREGRLSFTFRCHDKATEEAQYDLWRRAKVWGNGEAKRKIESKASEDSSPRPKNPKCQVAKVRPLEQTVVAPPSSEHMSDCFSASRSGGFPEPIPLDKMF